MKRFYALVLFLALAVIFIPWLRPAGADTVNVYDQKKTLIKSVVFAIGIDQYFVNGQYPGITMDAKPFVQDDRTFVPVRYLGYALGLTEKDIDWDNNIQKATMRGPITTIEMAIGSRSIVTMPTAKLLSNTLQIADRHLQIIDVAPVINENEGRTYLPARFVAEGLGYQVDWDEATQTVICWPQGDPKPGVSAVQQYIKQHQQQPTPQPQNTYTLNGYNVPVDTGLLIDKTTGPNDPNKAEMDFNIDLNKPLNSQYNDAVTILSSKFDSQTVNEILTYMKQKTDWKQELKNKFWKADGKTIGVTSPKGANGIEVTVWSVIINAN